MEQCDPQPRKSKCTRSDARYRLSQGGDLIWLRCGAIRFKLSSTPPPWEMLGCSSTIRLRCLSLSFPFTPCLTPALSRRFHHSTMSNQSVQLTAPNGRSYVQPIGLFINNEFVAAKSGEKFASINPS